MQWSSLLRVPGCCICAMLEKKPHNVSAPLLVKRGPSLRVLGRHIATVLKKE
jgi:hypothetical protein